MIARLRAAAGLLALALLAGCSTGKDAVVTGGEFEFIAPGGQTSVFYDPPAARRELRGLSGESLLEPGRTIGPDDFPGQVVVISVWGSWCGPCRTEMPDLQAFYDDHRPQGLELIGVNIQESAEDVTRYRQMLGISFPTVLDSDGAVTREYLVRGVPSTFFIDPQGTIRQVQIGPINRKGLNEKLARTLESDA